MDNLFRQQKVKAPEEELFFCIYLDLYPQLSQ